MADRIIRSRSPRVFRGAGQRRATEWLFRTFSSGDTTIPAASFIFDSSLTTAEKAKRPFTIIRTIGLLSVRSDQNAAIEWPFGALGMQVVSEKAVATGVTALPDPVTEGASDTWFVYQDWQSGTINTSERTVYDYPFESRAMRKIEEGFDVAIMIANASALHGVQYVLNFRMLIKVA